MTIRERNALKVRCKAEHVCYKCGEPIENDLDGIYCKKCLEERHQTRFAIGGTIALTAFALLKGYANSGEDRNMSIIDYPSNGEASSDAAVSNPIPDGLRCSRCGEENFELTNPEIGMLRCRSCGHQLTIRQTQSYWYNETECLYEKVARKKQESKNGNYDIDPNRWHDFEDGWTPY